jgi:hypothetical protein
MNRRVHRIALGFAAALFALGCSDRAATSDGAGGDVGGYQSPPTALTSTLLRRSVEAPWTTAFQGTRRVEAYWTIGAQSHVEIYRERVSADGGGRFAVEPIDLLTPGATAHDASLFQLLHAARAGFSYRYRDFCIRRIGPFRRNYTAQDVGSLAVVAGRNCVVLDVERKHEATLRYRIALDLETGLVLRCREEALDGTLIGLMEFESIDFAPDLSSVVWHVPANDEQELRDDPALQQNQLGFSLQTPRSVSGAFELIERRLVTDSSGPAPRRLAKFVYTDGVELVFFLHGEGTAPPALPDTAGVEDYVEVLDPSAKLGPWTVARGWMRGLPFLCMAKLSASDLLDLAASANY